MIKRLIIDVEAEEELLWALDEYVVLFRNMHRDELPVCASRMVEQTDNTRIDSQGFHREGDGALDDFTNRTVAALNEIELFGAKFKADGTRVYLNQSSALALLSWLQNFKDRFTHVARSTAPWWGPEVFDGQNRSAGS